MPKIFLTSDTHFGHNNIINLGKGRPFSNITEHDEALIENWNKVVGKGDIVYHLGDFSWKTDYQKIKDVLVKLNGMKFLIIGNHDREKIHSQALKDNLWQAIRKGHEFTYIDNDGKETRFVLNHFPILEFNGAYRTNTVHCYGHIHNMVNYDSIYKSLGFKAVHIGVDTSSDYPNTAPFTPILVDDVLERINKLFIYKS